MNCNHYKKKINNSPEKSHKYIYVKVTIIFTGEKMNSKPLLIEKKSAVY